MDVLHGGGPPWRLLLYGGCSSGEVAPLGRLLLHWRNNGGCLSNGGTTSMIPLWIGSSMLAKWRRFSVWTTSFGQSHSDNSVIVSYSVPGPGRQRHLPYAEMEFMSCRGAGGDLEPGAHALRRPADRRRARPPRWARGCRQARGLARRGAHHRHPDSTAVGSWRGLLLQLR